MSTKRKVRLPVAGRYDDDHFESAFRSLPVEQQKLLNRGAEVAQEALSGLRNGALGVGPDRASVARAYDTFVAAIGLVTARMMSQAPKEARPACRSGGGCDACCRQPVVVTFLEVAALADRMPQGTLGRARTFSARTAEKSFEEAWDLKLPCPMLDQRGNCMVYDRRPFVCATHHSLDRIACYGDRHANVPRLGALMALQYGLAGGLRLAQEGVGLDATPVSFDRALAAILEDPGLLDRWLAGEPLPESLRPLRHQES